MNKRTFTPSPENLESRVVLSGGPSFLNGEAVLSPGALKKAYSPGFDKVKLEPTEGGGGPEW
jgi:hypothetical protein